MHGIATGIALSEKSGERKSDTRRTSCRAKKRRRGRTPEGTTGSNIPKSAGSMNSRAKYGSSSSGVTTWPLGERAPGGRRESVRVRRNDWCAREKVRMLVEDGTARKSDKKLPGCQELSNAINMCRVRKEARQCRGKSARVDLVIIGRYVWRTFQMCNKQQ